MALRWKLRETIFWLHLFVFTVSAFAIHQSAVPALERQPSSGKDLYNHLKKSSKGSLVQGFPPRDTTVCHEPRWEVRVCTWVSCEPAALRPSLANSAFCLPVLLSKVRPLWKILALLIILEDCSRHIFRRDAVSFVCSVHPGKRVSPWKAILPAAKSLFFFPYFFKSNEIIACS